MKKIEIDIDIQNEQDKLSFTPEMDKLIRAAVEKSIEAEGAPPIAVSVVITDDGGIRGLNREYRGKDAATDVLSFPLYGGDGELDGEALGDIVISLERAAAQAKEYGHGIDRELAFLTAHSVLHLLGYDHETSEDDMTEMFRKQEEILALLGLERK